METGRDTDQSAQVAEQIAQKLHELMLLASGCAAKSTGAQIDHWNALSDSLQQAKSLSRLIQDGAADHA